MRELISVIFHRTMHDGAFDVKIDIILDEFASDMDSQFLVLSYLECDKKTYAREISNSKIVTIPLSEHAMDMVISSIRNIVCELFDLYDKLKSQKT